MVLISLSSSIFLTSAFSVCNDAGTVPSLEVDTIDPGVLIPAGTSSLPGLRFIDKHDTGWVLIAGSIIDTRVLGQQIMRMSSINVRFLSGTVSNPAIIGIVHTSSGISWPDVNTVAISTNGLEGFRVDANQSVVFSCRSR